MLILRHCSWMGTFWINYAFPRISYDPITRTIQNIYNNIHMTVYLKACVICVNNQSKPWMYRVWGPDPNALLKGRQNTQPTTAKKLNSENFKNWRAPWIKQSGSITDTLSPDANETKQTQTPHHDGVNEPNWLFWEQSVTAMLWERDKAVNMHLPSNFDSQWETTGQQINRSCQRDTDLEEITSA